MILSMPNATPIAIAIRLARFTGAQKRDAVGRLQQRHILAMMRRQAGFELLRAANVWCG